jgi:hypothetical protein
MKRLPITVLCAALLAGACIRTPDNHNNQQTNNSTTGATNAATNGATSGTTGATNNDTSTNGATNGDPGTNSATNNDTTGTNNGTAGTNNMTTGEPRALDVLMVIDNSGTMCRLQETFRDNIRAAIEGFAAGDLDVRIGVTTTHMDDEYALEPVAEPGQIQSTPQPVPGFDRSCHHGVDANGDPIDGDYTPIENAIAAAVACSETANAADFDFTAEEIECALYNMPQGCSISGVCAAGECEPGDLFPDPSTYRELPKVLEVRSYMNGGSVDLDALVDDFRCMSFVGTRGSGIEKGLDAAVAAVSPNLTGGPAEAPVDDTAPNHGLLRQDADFGLLFLTDENDCSHDGTLDEKTACGGDVCTFANIEGTVNSPLVDPAGLSDDFMDNLRMSKDDTAFDRSRVFVASIHGSWDRYDGPEYSDAECGDLTYSGIAPSCPASSGLPAYSGDRYERFLDTFDAANTYPAPNTDGDHRTGAVCSGDLGGAFSDALDLFAQ